jgi:hypothetical protein
MRGFAARATSSKPLLVTLVILLVIGAGSFSVPKAYAADLVPRSMRLSNSQAAATGVTYQLAFTVASGGPLGSLAIQFCQEGPLPFTPCTAPAGFDASGALLAVQSGEAGFSIYSGSTANEIILTRPPAFAFSGSASQYSFIGMTNPSDDGPVFIRLLTYASSDASGPATDTGGLVVAINPPATIYAEVPPFLLFCLGESISGTDCSSATEPFSDLGSLSPLATGAAQSQVLVATNAADGYTLWVLGTTMTSGNNVLPAMNGSSSQKGVSQFGMNLRANTNPLVGQEASGPGVGSPLGGYGQQNQFRFSSGDAIVTAPTPDDYRKYTVSYVVNVDKDQPGGVYSTTLTYVALANF